MPGPAPTPWARRSDWPTGLDRLPLDARAFYGTIVVATLIGVGINFIGLDPVKALFWAAVINGVVAVPLMVVIMIMATAPKVMGQFTVSAGLSAHGLAMHRRHGGRGGDHVRHLVAPTLAAGGAPICRIGRYLNPLPGLALDRNPGSSAAAEPAKMHIQHDYD